LTPDGVRAALASPGSTDVMTLRTYVEEVLVLSLHEGDAVVFDNLSAHMAPALAEAIDRAGVSVLPAPQYIQSGLHPDRRYGFDAQGVPPIGWFKEAGRCATRG